MNSLVCQETVNIITCTRMQLLVLITFEVLFCSVEFGNVMYQHLLLSCVNSVAQKVTLS